MATSYHDLLADAALRINAVLGTSVATLQTNYTVRPLTTAQFNSAIFPMSAIIEALSLAEQRLAHAIANSSSDNTYRTALTTQTPALANGALMPSTVGTASVIGVYGDVRDDADNSICTPRPLREITRRVANAGSFYRVPVYHFAYQGARIYHTRPTVIVDVCVYDHDAQIAAMVADGPVLLADDLNQAVISGALASLLRDDEFIEQGTAFAKYFATVLEGFTPLKGATA